MDEKAESLSSRLSNRGLRKSKNSCLDVMVKMKDLHTQLCNERPRAGPLYSPYRLILYDILGHPTSQGGYVPGKSLLHRHLGYCKWWHQMAWPS
jgi:hypothetical protein